MNVISPQKIVSLEFIIGIIQKILLSTKFTELAKKNFRFHENTEAAVDIFDWVNSQFSKDHHKYCPR
jgi:hypothetical protein